MVPTQLIFDRLMVLLGNDTLTLAQTTNTLKVFAVKAAFTPDQARLVGDLTPADFDGSTPKGVVPGDLPQSLDPQNGDSLLDFPPVAGGYRFETTGLTNLPQTIYGYGVMSNDSLTLFGCDLLPNGPVTLTAVNQAFELPRLTYDLPNGSIT